jgi:hypothetical protein
MPKKNEHFDVLQMCCGKIILKNWGNGKRGYFVVWSDS